VDHWWFLKQQKSESKSLTLNSNPNSLEHLFCFFKQLKTALLIGYYRGAINQQGIFGPAGTSTQGVETHLTWWLPL
jgi:hypothetical protein